MIDRRFPDHYINQRNFLFATAAAILLLIVAFFIYELKFLRSPHLDVLMPADNIATTTDVIDVRGRSDPDADLTVNGRPLYSGETGNFSERLYLGEGVNRLEFEAKNRYGKTTRITRYIVVK